MPAFTGSFDYTRADGAALQSGPCRLAEPRTASYVAEGEGFEPPSPFRG